MTDNTTKLKFNHEGDSTFKTIFGSDKAGQDFMDLFWDKAKKALEMVKNKETGVKPSTITEQLLNLLTEEEKEKYLMMQLLNYIIGRGSMQDDCDCSRCQRRREEEKPEPKPKTLLN